MPLTLHVFPSLVPRSAATRVVLQQDGLPMAFGSIFYGCVLNGAPVDGTNFNVAELISDSTVVHAPDDATSDVNEGE
jgi:hypothetical protein